MPTISGELNFVSSRAAHVNEIWVRAPHVRTSAGGVVVTQNDRFPVQDGQVEFTCLTGPAILSLMSDGRAVDTVPIVVGESSSQTLRQVVAAAQVADEATQSEIEKLAAQAVHLIDTSTESATRAESARDRAETAASGAAQSATKSANSATDSGKSAKSASDSASAAKKSAGDASSSATAAKTAETNARSQASEAAKSATAAKADADRTARVADSTSWKGDQLTVNGKTSPHLTGPKGDRGPAGESGKWTDLTGVPTKFPPEDHKHTSNDITDSVSYFGSPGFANRVVKTNVSGHLHDANDPTEDNQLTRKGYVDSVVSAAGKSGQLFYGYWNTVGKENYLFIATPRMMGKVEFKSVFSGEGRTLVMPVVYDKNNSIIHDGVDTWGKTSAYHFGPFQYAQGTTTHAITLPSGTYIDGVVIGGWDGDSYLRSLEFDAERVAPVQTTVAEYAAVQAYGLRAKSELGGRLVKSDDNGRITVHDDMFDGAPDAVVNKRYVDTTVADKADKSYVDARIQLVSSLPSKPDSDVLYVIAE